MANVRLTKARPWIVGLRKGSILGGYEPIEYATVKLTHLGEERFRGRDDMPYPKGSDEQHPGYVLHQDKPITFKYKSDGLSWDPVKNTFTPGQLFKPGVAGAKDGDLGFPPPGANVTDVEKSEYAPIGPFAKWRLTVRPEDNTDDPKKNPLNWDNVQAIVIDFHVFMQGFDDDLVQAARAGSNVS